MTIRRLVFAAIVFTFFGTELSATTYPAASCNESDVQAAYTAEQASKQDGDIISIPDCHLSPGIWNSYWTISPTNSLTFQGAGAMSATSGGASSTGTDLTIIYITTPNVGIMTLTTSANKSYRITGINFRFPDVWRPATAYTTNTVIVDSNGHNQKLTSSNCTSKSSTPSVNPSWNTSGGTTSDNTCTWTDQGALDTSGGLLIQGSSTSVRYDHNHIMELGSGMSPLYVKDLVMGVVDHNFVEKGGPKGISFLINVQNGTNWDGDTTGQGDGSWSEDSYWGSSKFIFVEDNLLNNLGQAGGEINDCYIGGRGVIRYNTMYGYGIALNHEGQSSSHGCRAMEVYKNQFQPFLAWQANTFYMTGGNITDAASHTQKITSGNCISGSTLPSWPETTGSTTSDGTCVWTDQALYEAQALSGSRSGSFYVWGNNSPGTQIAMSGFLDRVGGYNGVPPGDYVGMCGNGNLKDGFVGIVNTSGTAVTLTSGNNTWGTNMQFPTRTYDLWPNTSNPYIYIAGVRYTVASVTDATHLTLTTSAGTQTGVVYYVPSVWDGNADDTGYPCWDQPGRGKGDRMTGTIQAGNRLNSITGTATWPHNVLDPVYVWANSLTQQVAVIRYNENLSKNNRDYFYDGMSTATLTQTSPTAPFNGALVTTDVSSWSATSSVLTITVSSTAGFSVGQIVNTNALATGSYGLPIDVTAAITAINSGAKTISMAYPYAFADSGGAGGTVSSIGVGQGTLANRPTTCTQGTDLALGNIAAPGVAYWATDAVNTQDAAHPGVLYVCNPTNTWTAYYTPYTYPHPLNGTTPPPGTPPTPPTNLAATPQ